MPTITSTVYNLITVIFEREMFLFLNILLSLEGKKSKLHPCIEVQVCRPMTFDRKSLTRCQLVSQ